MKQKKLKEGINLCMIRDEKFKAFRACIMLSRPLTREEVTLNSLTAAVMRMQSKSYPSQAKMSEALENLYGADLIARASRYGERQIVKIGVQAICDDAIGKSGNFKNALNMIFDIVLYAGDGTKFSQSITETEKKNIADALLSQKNDKRSYSVLRLQEEMCKSEAYGVNPLGYIDSLEKISTEELYSHYKKILAESRIDIMFTGNFNEDEAEAAARGFAECLKERNPMPVCEQHIEKVEKIKNVTDKMDVTQGKLCIGFRCGKAFKDNYAATTVYNTILGGSATSKLFENVREKLSLCYYVGSSLDRLKEIMVIRSGVEFADFEKAYDEIMLQQEKMKKGEFSEDEINAAKKHLVTAYESNYDGIDSLSEYYTMQLLLGTNTEIGEMTGKIEKVTAEEIVKVANEMMLDTIYRLERSENE